MEPVTVTEGEEYILPSCGFLPPDGMVFASWNLGRVHAKITVTEDTVLVAQWAEIPVRADARLLAKLTPAGNKSLKLTWTKVKGAEGYDIFFGKCLTPSALLASVRPNDRTYTISKLINGQSYKAYVRAWKMLNGKKFYIGGRSPYVHAIVGGSNKTHTTQKAVKVQNLNVRIQLGKTHQIQATVELYDSKKISLVHEEPPLRYYSSNINIATVNGDGVVTAVNTGSCTIYVLANSGVRADVKITVTREAPPPETVKVKTNGGVYEVHLKTKKAKLIGVTSKSITSLTVADSVKYNGKSYRVTAIEARACQNLTKLKKVIIGKNVTSIGKRAFFGCAALKSITIKTTQLKDAKVGDAAFKGIYKKAKVTVPSGRLKAYQKLLVRKGMPKTAKITQ